MLKFLKKLLINLSMAVIGIILAILILELLLRLMGAKPQTYLRKFSQYHPVLGWVKTPNMDGEFIKGSRKIHEKINSHGLRDIEYTYDKPDSTFRILIIGDSFTEGYDVEFDYLFTEVLESMLNDSLRHSGYRYEIINAGTGGYSNDQEYLYYLHEGRKYSPDIVIMMMYATNDIYYNNQNHYGNYAKPLYRTDNERLILTNTPLPAPKTQESFKNIFRNMVLYPFVTNIIFTKFPGFTQWLSEKGFISKSTMEHVTHRKKADPEGPAFPASFKVFNRKYDDEMNQAWLITEYIMRDLNDTARQNNSRFILFSIPDKFQIYGHLWEATQKAYRVNDSVWNRDKPDEIIKTFAEKYDFPALFLKDYIEDHQIKDYLHAGVHWNENGNRVVAGYIFKELLTRKLLPFGKDNQNRH